MLSTKKCANPETLAEQLHSAAVRLLRSVREADQRSSLNAPRLSALSVIVFAGPITLGELANAEQVRPPTMTRIVQALEDQGLVAKRIDQADRRSVRLSATISGKRLLIRARRQRTQALAQRIGLLSSQEQSSLEGAVDVMVKLTTKRYPS
jgi:DNA-binding MarR family transcriptional regulator